MFGYCFVRDFRDGLAAGEDCEYPAAIALRRSPKPGAFTAATCSVHVSFVDHESSQRFSLDIF